MIKAYKFRIYPDKEQIAILVNALNACRELYNAMLQQRIYAYRMGRKVTRYSQVNEIPEVKKAFPEFNNIHSQVIQDVPLRLDRAYDNFYRRVDKKNNGRNIKAGFPRFKSKNRYNSITYPQSGFKILENGHILASKIGEVRMFMHHPVDGKIRTLTFKRNSAGEWYAVITAGNIVLLVDPGNTSKMCSMCGNIKKDLKLSDRVYNCDVCGLTIDRDEDAAINIKNRGLLLFLYAYVYLHKLFKKVGRGTPEFTPEETGALPARATPRHRSRKPAALVMGGCHYGDVY